MSGIRVGHTQYDAVEGCQNKQMSVDGRSTTSYLQRKRPGMPNAQVRNAEHSSCSKPDIS